MSSIVNLISNLNDLTKTKSVTDLASQYKAQKLDLTTPTPALSQGEKFKKYQKKIKRNLENKINNVNSKEGFTGIPDGLLLDKDGLTKKSTKIIDDNTDYLNKDKTKIDDLREQYNNTLQQYQTVISEITATTTGYFDRINPNNPYLGKNVRFSNGSVCYVTQQGVVKGYGSEAAVTATAGLNGCPAQSNIVNINIDFSKYYAEGSIIPTTPPLVTGSPMISGQSCGNEGSNVYVNKMISNPNSTYMGCYADNATNTAMTFIGGSPPPPSVTIQNGNFAQPTIVTNTYEYISSIPGWGGNFVLTNDSQAWGYTIPYPSGSQCVSLQETGYIYQILNLQAGITYTVSFVACGRACCDGSGLSNPINIQLRTTSNQLVSTIYNFQPPISVWTNYSTTFTVPTSQNYNFQFSGTWTAGDRSTAIQNIQLNSSGSASSGSYTYNQCQEAAIDGGYQYFALQNVNQSTGKGFCAVSNSEPSITANGTSYVPSGWTFLWTSNTTGNGTSAILTVTGSLSVVNSGGTSVYSTPNSGAQPSNYLGCYGDSSNRAIPLYNNGAQSYNLSTCQQLAQQNGATYFGLQDSTSGTNAQCGFSSNLAQAIQYGTANNCTKISDGSWSGGGWSNAVYNTSLPQSNYFLVLQDDGNMCIYRGTSPTDNQGSIWCSMTNGKLQQANPAYAAEKGKYGQNWIASGSTLAPGDFVGSSTGNMALIMQSDGNLVLYTFSNVINCQKMSNNKMGGGVNANAAYNIGQVGIPGNLGKVGYIDSNSDINSYPDSNIQYTNKYTKFSGMDSGGNDTGGAYGNATVDQCKTTCNSSQSCAGFGFSNNTCYPKTSGMYPTGAYQSNENVDLYTRDKGPITTPFGISNIVNNITSLLFQNYTPASSTEPSFNLSSATAAQQQQLAQLQTQMDTLSSKIANLTGDLGYGSVQAEEQSSKNVKGIEDYLKGINNTNKKIKNFDTNVENILKDSDIIVLQKNYEYLFWSILTVGALLVTMNIVKK